MLVIRNAELPHHWRIFISGARPDAYNGARWQYAGEISCLKEFSRLCGVLNIKWESSFMCGCLTNQCVLIYNANAQIIGRNITPIH